jgi:hypothetical protein
VELDVYTAAVATQQATAQHVSHAHQQQVERLRYEAMLAQRQFTRVDPDNRLVASELEKRWECALADLKQAEEAEATRMISPPSLLALSSELQTACASNRAAVTRGVAPRTCEPAAQKSASSRSD